MPKIPAIEPEGWTVRDELREMRRDIVTIRVRMGWLFGGLAALGVLDLFPACSALLP